MQPRDHFHGLILIIGESCMNYTCSKGPSAPTLLAVALLAIGPMNLLGQGQSPQPVRSRANEVLDMWNHVGNKLIAMAQDFPEELYDFRVQEAQRTFAQNLLHVASVD